MKRKSLLIGAVLFTALAFSACGSTEDKSDSSSKSTPTESASESTDDNKEIDINEVAEAITSEVKFDNELAVQDETVANSYFQLAEGTEAIVYFSSDPQCYDTVALFSCASDDDVAAVLDNVQLYIDGVKEQTEKYLPEEAEKVENAIVKSEGNCAVLCITNDSDTANEVIGRFFN